MQKSRILTCWGKNAAFSTSLFIHLTTFQGGKLLLRTERILMADPAVLKTFRIQSGTDKQGTVFTRLTGFHLPVPYSKGTPCFRHFILFLPARQDIRHQTDLPGKFFHERLDTRNSFQSMQCLNELGLHLFIFSTGKLHFRSSCPKWASEGSECSPLPKSARSK